MQNVQHTITPAQAPFTAATPAEKLAEAGLLITKAVSHTDDEAHDYLSWSDRESIARQLHAALRLLREAREQITITTGIASCLECGTEEFAQALASGCPTCAYAEAVELSH